MTLLSCGQICQQSRQFIRMHDGSKTFFFHMHCGFPKGSGIVALPRWSHAATENITTKNFGYTKIEHWLKNWRKTKHIDETIDVTCKGSVLELFQNHRSKLPASHLFCSYIIQYSVLCCFSHPM